MRDVFITKKNCIYTNNFLTTRFFLTNNYLEVIFKKNANKNLNILIFSLKKLFFQIKNIFFVSNKVDFDISEIDLSNGIIRI